MALSGDRCYLYGTCASFVTTISSSYVNFCLIVSINFALHFLTYYLLIHISSSQMIWQLLILRFAIENKMLGKLTI